MERDPRTKEPFPPTQSETELVLLSILLFHAKCVLRAEISQAFEGLIDEYDSDSPSEEKIEELVKIVGNDGLVAEGVSKAIVGNPKKRNFFTFLSDKDIQKLCSKLEKTFEEEHPGGQYIDIAYDLRRPDAFALNVTAEILPVMSTPSPFSRPEQDPLFGIIGTWEGSSKKPYDIVSEILNTYNGQNYTQLLPGKEVLING